MPTYFGKIFLFVQDNIEDNDFSGKSTLQILSIVITPSLAVFVYGCIIA